MSNCQDLCTAAKCQELETALFEAEQLIALNAVTIQELRGDLNRLQLDFDAHLNKKIPDAHDYNSNLRIDGSFWDNQLTLTVADAITSDTASIEIFPSDVRVSASISDSDLTINVSVGTESDSTTIALPEFDPFVTVDVFPQEDNQFAIKVGVNGEFDEDVFSIETNSCDEPLRINGSYFNENLNLSISFCGENDSVNIPILLEQDVNYYINNYNNEGGETMECDLIQVLTELDNQRNAIELAAQSISNLVESKTNEIRFVTDNIYSEVTVSLSHSTERDYNYEFELDDDEDIIPTYPVVTSSPTSYGNAGLAAIHEALKLVLENQQAIYRDAIKAIPPKVDSDLEKTIEIICQSEGLQPKEDFASTQEYITYLKEELSGALEGTVNAILLKQIVAGLGDDVNSTVSLPLSWTTIYLLDKYFNTQKKGIQKICDDLSELEQQDVVAIVASEKDAHRVKSKVLILHFVLLDVYPKRSRSDAFWQVQIPAARDSYDWTTDFDVLRRTHGNQYAELQFNENFVPVSGWFSSETEANSFFDAVLTLTNATEKNRVFPKHTNPETTIATVTTRPYRAFIKSVDASNRPVCHAKYVPVIDEP